MDAGPSSIALNFYKHTEHTFTHSNTRILDDIALCHHAKYHLQL